MIDQQQFEAIREEAYAEALEIAARTLRETWESEGYVFQGTAARAASAILALKPPAPAFVRGPLIGG